MIEERVEKIKGKKKRKEDEIVRGWMEGDGRWTDEDRIGFSTRYLIRY